MVAPLGREGSLGKQSFPAVVALAAVWAALFVPGALLGQQPGETRIHKINKSRGDNGRQAFTGKIQSVDTKLKVLNMKAEEGVGTEIFPLKKSVDIESANGEKMKLAQLKPGSNVVIYYQLKGGQRTVKQIILLSPGFQEAKKKPSPPS